MKELKFSKKLKTEEQAQSNLDIILQGMELVPDVITIVKHIYFRQQKWRCPVFGVALLPIVIQWP